MRPGRRTVERMLREARRLAERRDYAAVAGLLAPLEEAELIGEPTLGFLLAEAWQHRGESARALALVERLAPVCARRGNDPLGREVLNLEGVLRFGLGDVEGAERAWGKLLVAAASAGDDSLVARANNNFGVAYTLRGDRERALASYARATAACQRLGYLRGLAQAHNNLGITYREMDFFAESDHHFQRAVDYARADGSVDEEGRATIERALLLGYRRDVGLAHATAERARGLWRQLEDPVGEGESCRVLAIVAGSAGRWEDAERYASEALELATRSGAALLEAEVLEVGAVLAERGGEGHAAERRRARATELFAAMGAAAWGEQVRARLRHLTA